MTNSPPIPIIVISGFLGAGKTTFLNQVLCGCVERNIALLINDFGSINLDARLTSGIGKITFRLSNGCICCSKRDELHHVLMSLIDMADPPELIMIEASAVANPLSIAEVCSSPGLRRGVYLDSIVTITNAEQLAGMTGGIAQLANIQVSAADIILLNKIDLVTPIQLNTTRNKLEKVKPETPIIDMMYGHAPLEILLPDEGKYRYSLPYDSVLDHWTYTSLEPFQWEMLRAVLDHIFRTVYRVRGSIHLANKPKIKFLLNVVGKRISLLTGGPWSDVPRSRLVFLGAWGTDEISSSLQRELDACKLSNQENDSVDTGISKN